MTLDEYIAALERVARSGADDLGMALATTAATTWRDVTKQVAPVDTGQLKARTVVVALSSDGAEIQIDVPYASHVEYGTRGRAGRGMFATGRDAAEQVIASTGAQFDAIVAEMIESGGVARPRSLPRPFNFGGGAAPTPT